MCVISLCTRGALDTWSRGRSTAALGANAHPIAMNATALRVCAGLTGITGGLGFYVALGAWSGHPLPILSSVAARVGSPEGPVVVVAALFLGSTIMLGATVALWIAAKERGRQAR